MAGVLYQYLASDHGRLDHLLEQAAAKPGVIDVESYADFRKGLLRHISIEEKIVFPAVAKFKGRDKIALTDRLHIDHAAIVSLMVPPPSLSIIQTLKSVFAVHNPLEENNGGLYDLFEASVGADIHIMLEEITAAPAVCGVATQSETRTPPVGEAGSPTCRSRISRMMRVFSISMM